MYEYVQTTTTKPTDRAALNIDSWAEADNSLATSTPTGQHASSEAKRCVPHWKGMGLLSVTQCVLGHSFVAMPKLLYHPMHFAQVQRCP